MTTTCDEADQGAHDVYRSGPKPSRADPHPAARLPDPPAGPAARTPAGRDADRGDEKSLALESARGRILAA
jgi:hypothetical protein